MAKFEKGEFLSKVEAFAKEMSEKTNGNKNRGIIILATETDENNPDADKQIIALMGKGEKIKDALVSFFSQEQPKPLIMEAVKEVTAKSFIKKFMGGNELNIIITK